MRSLLSFVFVLCTTLTSFAQDWTRQQIGDSVSVLFPREPEYKTQDKMGGYFLKSTNCAFLVLMRFQAVPDYIEFAKLKAPKRQSIIAQALDDYPKGILEGNHAKSEIRTTKIGRYTCKEIDYTDINPATRQEGKRFTKAIIVGLDLITFECWYMNDSKEAEAEKTTFFNSILTK